jgi:hypothetical protein
MGTNLEIVQDAQKQATFKISNMDDKIFFKEKLQKKMD